MLLSKIITYVLTATCISDKLFPTVATAITVSNLWMCLGKVQNRYADTYVGSRALTPEHSADNLMFERREAAPMLALYQCPFVELLAEE